ncbi:hypothetical protein [Bosea sp. (in: a-proteobacteria)]|uniref:hypothetical protein n=1 Tax=Bosea sp. (in: a-proteobacteria) TaxID=1871050 RepID=UPI001AC7747E|nr:hypothetical protein [Bosea sp. (in: a-proteobacteria)]MBN9438488.1 hypothetical protein [Bosea sp. (in: a-proteobacteria)]
MPIPNSRRRATARVITDNVSLGGGVTLPQGDYAAVVEMMHIAMQGRVHDQTARVTINLTAEFLTELGLPPKGELISIDMDVLQYVISGDIIEV